MKKSDITKLVISILIPLALGAIAGRFTAQAVPDWFASLNRPLFSPPNWIFGPVWTVLYLLLGISLFLIWKQFPSKQRNNALWIFSLQMFLNFIWSFVFFYFNQIGLALFVITGLWISIIFMLISFYKIKPLSAYLNIPYLLWVTFALVLNAGYFILN
ncbi:MAG TPA: TspO/MBR family protein [Ignavibacteriaceae bacterium]|nr:TspO/MBR family protein [Ignavibacteriaceae bacterium]